MIMTFNKVVYIIWGIFFLFWVISVLRHPSQTERRESLLSRLLYLGLIGKAISLVLFDPLIFGPLLWNFLPEKVGIDLIGLVILLLGLGFAVWARLHLGRYWSTRIALAKGHLFVQTGPYSLVRNPIFLGGLAGMIGTAVVIGEVRALLAVIFVLIAFLQKIKLDEALLSERFGPAYQLYQKKVKALIPFVY